MSEERRVVRLIDLTPEQRHLVLALIAIGKARAARSEPKPSQPPETSKEQ